MSVPICEPTYMYGENMLMIHNISKSTLKKNCNVIAYHAFHECLAMRELFTEENYSADLHTNIVIGQKRKHLVSLVSYDTYYEDT